MPESLIDESNLKKLLKQALIEIIKEEKDLLYDLVTETIEDIALATAINGGKDTEKNDKSPALQENSKHQKYDFSDLTGKLTLQGEPLSIQKEMRNAW